MEQFPSVDIGAIPEMLEPILRILVNPPDDNGALDMLCVPLSILDERIPGISDIAGTKINMLDVAETFVGKESGAPAVRVILGIWRGLQKLTEVFASADEDGILLASHCTFKPYQDMTCTGGVSDFFFNNGSRKLMERAIEMEEVRKLNIILYTVLFHLQQETYFLILYQ